MASDLDQLVDMGFEREKAEIAMKKGGNLGGAIDWLEQNADRSVEELKNEGGSTTGAAPEAAVGPNSYVCGDCGRKLRNLTAFQAHAEKTGHTNVEESSEVLPPMSEDEKKAKLEELREKLAAKRAGQSEEDRLAQKRNDEIKKKHTKETEDAKEELQRKEQIKEAAKKRQEKADDIAAKKRIKEKIEADKAERRRKAEEEKAMRANPSAFDPQAATSSGASAPAQPKPKAAVNHTEARLRLQTEKGNVMKNFGADRTLFELTQELEVEPGITATSFTQNFPKKVWKYEDFNLTLKEAGWVPSAALIVS
jgi:UBX domain-containing protein 1/4